MLPTADSAVFALRMALERADGLAKGTAISFDLAWISTGSLKENHLVRCRPLFKVRDFRAETATERGGEQSRGRGPHPREKPAPAFVCGKSSGSWVSNRRNFSNRVLKLLYEQ